MSPPVLSFNSRPQSPYVNVLVDLLSDVESLGTFYRTTSSIVNISGTDRSRKQIHFANFELVVLCVPVDLLVDLLSDVESTPLDRNPELLWGSKRIQDTQESTGPPDLKLPDCFSNK